MKLSGTSRWLLLLPSILFLTVPLYGLLAAVFQSLRGSDGWTMEAYRSLLESERFFSSIGFSLYVTLSATLLSILSGWLFTRAFYPFLKNTAPRLLVWLPMVFPHFVWGYMVILVLSEYGLLSNLLASSGLVETTEQFPIWTRDPNGIGIIITYIWKEVPFVILMLLPVYGSIQQEYYDLVQTLGGNKWRQLTAVEWPIVLPVLAEIFLILFSFILTAYEVPALLGTTFPEMIGVLSFEWYFSGSWEDRPIALAVMVFLTGAIAFLTFITYGLLRKRRRSL